MSNISNANAFTLEAGIILAAAYNHFPMIFSWSPDADTDHYPTELGASRASIQTLTIQWLLDEDYLRKKAGGMVLSNRGLVALNSVPDQLSGRESLGKRLVSAVGKEIPAAIISLLPFIAEHFANSNQ